MDDYEKWLPVVMAASGDCNITYWKYEQKEASKARKIRLLAGVVLNLKRSKRRLFLAGLEIPNRIIEFSPSIISLFCKSTFPHASVILAEDGSGSYNGEIFKIKYNFVRFELWPDQRQGLIWRFAHIVCRDRFNKAPSLLLVHDCGWLIYKPPCPVENFAQHDVSAYFTCLRSDTDINYEDYSVIALGEPFQELNLGSDELEAAAIFEVGISAVYRPHPRQLNIYEGFKVVDRNPRNWELRCGSELSENHILLGVGSSAMMTPLLLYGLQPYLVFTYLLHSSLSVEFSKVMDDIVSEVKSKYADSGKILVPSTYDELVHGLQSIAFSLREKPDNAR